MPLVTACIGVESGSVWVLGGVTVNVGGVVPTNGESMMIAMPLASGAAAAAGACELWILDGARAGRCD